MQPMYIFVEDVFVVRETGQGTVYCVSQSEKFLCVFIKSLMRSLSPLFQRIDCINHGGKRREFHLQTLFQLGPQRGITFGLQMCEHRSSSFQGSNAVFSPMLIID